jgi:hypothetical protein
MEFKAGFLNCNHNFVNVLNLFLKRWDVFQLVYFDGGPGITMLSWVYMKDAIDSKIIKTFFRSVIINDKGSQRLILCFLFSVKVFKQFEQIWVIHNDALYDWVIVNLYKRIATDASNDVINHLNSGFFDKLHDSIEILVIFDWLFCLFHHHL